MKSKADPIINLLERHGFKKMFAVRVNGGRRLLDYSFGQLTIEIDETVRSGDYSIECLYGGFLIPVEVFIARLPEPMREDIIYNLDLFT